jgi:E3 ubiquitin-protein ligase DOA10
LVLKVKLAYLQGGLEMRTIIYLGLLFIAFSLNGLAVDQIQNEQHLLKQMDEKFDEELNDVDFSQDELKKLREFMHKGIKSKSLEELQKNAELIRNNTQTLLEQYQDHDTSCKARHEALGNSNYAEINKNCYNEFIKGICPLYPFC